MEDSSTLVFKTLGSVYGRTKCYRFEEEERGKTDFDQLVPKHEHHPLSIDLELSLNYNT